MSLWLKLMITLAAMRWPDWCLALDVHRGLAGHLKWGCGRLLAVVVWELANKEVRASALRE